MRIDSISIYGPYPKTDTKKITTALKCNKNTLQNFPYVQFSFKGNPSKVPTQIGAYATESNFLGGIYTAGGLGDVASLFPEAVGLKAEDIVGKKIDIRTFLPYYTMEDTEGRIYVLTKEGAEKKNNLKKGELLDFKKDFKLVNQDYKLQEGESFAVITQLEGDEASKNVKKYFTLKDTGLSGTSNRMAEHGLEMESVPYRVFEVDAAGKKDRIYLIHTPEHAKGNRAYGIYATHAQKEIQGASSYGAAENTGVSAYGAANPKKTIFFASPKTDDMFFTEQIRAYEQLTIEGKMNTEAYGNFNPQNHLLHDRFSYPSLTDVVQKAKNGDKNYQGLVFDEIMHNPGAAYQGKYSNPLDFFKIIATDKDLAKLQANEHYAKIRDIAGKIEKGNVTEEECAQLYKFFEPFFKKFKDTEGYFNMTMLAVKMTDENPKNSSIGNVSKNYGKETRNLKTTDIAKGLTQPLIDIQSKTIDVVNGSKQANMATDAMGKFFGTGTLNETMKTKYNTYKPTDSPEKIFAAKMENKKVVIDELADATKKLDNDPDALAKVFFSKDKIAKLRKNAEKAGDPDVKLVLGSMSEYKLGDMLFIGWGRPDPQKGLTVTLEAFENVLKDESIPLETRKHCKLVMGSGSGTEDMFTKASEEWKLIEETVSRIENMELNGQKGIFKGNVVYTNGTYPARIANCADLGILTSRFEPCGITPLECFASGTPVLSTNTGGAPDFIRPGKNGFLTKDPFMINPEELGLSANAAEKEIDAARRSNIAKQVAEQVRSYLEPLKNGSWEVKQQEYIKNCAGEKIEWHNNNSYNGGKSALEIYLKEKLNVLSNDVPTEYASDMRGDFDNSAFPKPKPERKPTTVKPKNFFRSKAGKLTLAGACAALIAGLGYAIVKNSHKKQELNINNIDYDDYLDEIA